MSKEPRNPPWWAWILVLLSVPLVIASLLLWLFTALTLLAAVWLTWLPRRKYALVVYSNSPVWQEYFQTQVLPQLRGRAAVLNWSERSRWRLSLPVILFRTFAGSRDFNPIAILFQPMAWPRHFRFYEAFRAFKRGRPAEVEKLRNEFFASLDDLAPPRDVP